MHARDMIGPDVTLSYPVLDRRDLGDYTLLLATLQPFKPNRELVLRWASKKRRDGRR